MWTFKRMAQSFSARRNLRTGLLLVLVLGPGLFLSTTTSAREENWFLKFGPSASSTRIHFPNFNAHSSLSTGLGFHSQVSYQWPEWELGLHSYAFMSQIKRVQMEAGGSQVQGKFTLRRVSMGPILKGKTDLYLAPTWPLHFLVGPLIGLQTFKTRGVTIQGGNYQPHQKLATESFGLLCGLGSQEESPVKNHQIYYEFSYQYLRAKTLSIVGGTHTSVLTLQREKGKKYLSEHSFVLAMGMVIF